MLDVFKIRSNMSNKYRRPGRLAQSALTFPPREAIFGRPVRTLAPEPFAVNREYPWIACRDHFEHVGEIRVAP